MMPVLLDVDLGGWDLRLPTYGVLIAAAFLAALWFAIGEARRAGLPREPVLDLWMAALVSGILGGKILLFLLDLDYYLAHPRAILTGLRSLGVFYGGFAAAVATCAYMVARRGLPGWRIADAAAPAVALGQSIGRIGCFAAGCCYGRPSQVPWAVTFTDPRAREFTGVPLGVPLHPSQLYLSAADLALFGLLLLIARRKRYHGQVFLWYLLLYSVLRAALEVTRGDPRGELMGFSTSQVIASAAAVTAALLMIRRRRTLPAAAAAAR